ncbi:MAG: right-handed parallel beta-helix repeat-containing protein [FCB group bacterium]|nr:right-handed parallel beta-helix repeat-containing protein [FCB group bacterium]
MKTLAVLSTVLLVIQIAAATTLLVPSVYPDIQSGIDAAIDGDTVLVADGTYTGTGNKNINFLGKRIVVISDNGPDNCIIDCEYSGRGFFFRTGEDSNSVLSGITITNGQLFSGSYWDACGGGILTYDCSPIIENCLIINNNAYGDGGGIFCYYAAPIIRDCIISGNTAQGGGGIQAIYANLRIENCTIDSNLIWAEETGGGGIACGDSTIISNSIITNNSAIEWQSGGGGIMCYDDVIITGCTISGNSADAGGGVWCTGAPTLIDCMISNNSSSDAGGLMCGLDANPRLINCIITENNGPGIHCYDSVVELAGCNISFNEGGGIKSSTGAQVIFDRLNRCSIYGNYQIWYPNGNDLYYCPNLTEVIVDTFTVMNPTDYFATPIHNYTFDILHAYLELNSVNTVIGNDVMLSWTEIPGASVYHIYRSDEPYFDITGMDPIASITETSFIDTNALIENKFFYRLTWED